MLRVLQTTTSKGSEDEHGRWQREKRESPHKWVEFGKVDKEGHGKKISKMECKDVLGR